MLGLDFLHGRLANLHTGGQACHRIPTADWDHTDPCVVEQEDQVVMSHQGDHSEGHPQEARLVALLVARLDLVETTIRWERDNRRLEVGCQRLGVELPLSLWILGLEG